MPCANLYLCTPTSFCAVARQHGNPQSSGGLSHRRSVSGIGGASARNGAREYRPDPWSAWVLENYSLYSTLLVAFVRKTMDMSLKVRAWVRDWILFCCWLRLTVNPHFCLMSACLLKIVLRYVFTLVVCYATRIRNFIVMRRSKGWSIILFASGGKTTCY